MLLSIQFGDAPTSALRISLTATIFGVEYMMIESVITLGAAETIGWGDMTVIGILFVDLGQTSYLDSTVRFLGLILISLIDIENFKPEGRT
jgi:hypothetical protein